MSEKELKVLQEEEIEKVSGGHKNVFDNAVCDSCGKELKYNDGGLPLTNNRHICTKCLKNVSAVLPPEAIAAWIKRNG